MLEMFAADIGATRCAWAPCRNTGCLLLQCCSMAIMKPDRDSLRRRPVHVASWLQVFGSQAFLA